MKKVNTFKGIIFDKDHETAFINRRGGTQVWLPRKGLRIGDKVKVTVQVYEER